MKFKIVRGLLVGAFAVSLTSVAAINQIENSEQPKPSEVMEASVLEEDNAARTSAGKSAGESNYVASAGVVDVFGSYIAEVAVNAAEQGQAANALTVQETGKEEVSLAIATVDNYVNIRTAPTTEAEVAGKLYNHSVGIIVAQEADWYQIQSGNVTGYVKAEYVLTGEEGAALADEVGQHLATVNTTTLKVRVNPSTEDKVLGLVPEGDTLTVLEEVEGWVKVAVEEGEGYVSTDYVDTFVKNVEAESKEEEEARLAK